MGKLNDYVEVLDFKRIPVSSQERATREKIYPYYGAQGIVDYIDDFIFDGEYILVAEDGENLRSLHQNIATWATGKFWVNNHAHILGEKETANLKYLYYYLNWIDLRRYVTGSAQPKLNQDNLSNIDINLPPRAIQDHIAQLLSKIDDKIALNNRVNATLEAMAKTLYDYWFVQFDFPDEKGRPYKTSGGKMVYNEELGREIPAGWEVVPLTAVCKIVDCLHSQKPNQFYESEKFFLLQLENIVPLGLVDIRNKYYVKSADYELWTSKIEIQEGDLLITNAGRVGAFSRVPKGIRAGIGRNITAIRPQQVSAIYFYYYLHSIDCKRQIRLNTDVGAFFDSLNVKGLKNMYVLLPPKRLMQLFDKQGGYCRERLESAAKESEQLAALRDWLLPMLMNGQVGFRKGF